jgi:alkylhydroperoxidase family enzyme
MPPRLRPLEPSEWSEDVRRLLGGTLDGVAALEGGSREHSRPLNILGTIAHHPSLLGPFLGFAATLATRGVLSRRDSELLALRTAWNCRSAFEWGHHVVYGRAAGLGEAEIGRVCVGPAADEWTDHERLLLEAADELHLEHQIRDETWKRLREELDEAQLVELPFVVGNYAMLSMVANATGVPLEEGLPELPASPAADGRALPTAGAG